jgi:glycerol-3-phosphate acyltransferase PlsY
MQTLYSILAAFVAYLIGSISFAVVVSRAMGLADPRTFGSRNPGATNVLRTGNKAAAVLTLLLDALKGFLPVLVVRLWGARWGFGDGTVALVGLAAFLGHLWPVFFHFQGGKGVATAAGVLLGLNPWLGAATLLTWIIIAAFFRYSSLASIVSAVFAPFYQLLIWGGGPEAVAITVMSLLLLWRHAPNMRKLFAGTESRLGQKSSAPAAAAHASAGAHAAAPAKGTRAHAAGDAHHAADHGSHPASHHGSHGKRRGHGAHR